MRDFIYDLRRTLSGKFTIVAIAVIIILSALIGYALTTAASSSAQPTIHTSASYTYSNGTYNVSIFAFNQNGQPAATLPIYVQYNNTYANLTTASDGFADYSFHSTGILNFNYSLSQIYNNTGGSKSIMFLDSKYSENSVQMQFTTITKPGTTNQREVLLYYSPTFLNDTSTHIYVYYKILNSSQVIGMHTPLTLSNLTYFTQLTANKVGYKIIDINPSNLSATQLVYVQSSNSNATGNVTAYSTSYYLPRTIFSQETIASLVFTVFAEFFGLLIPILATLSAYYYFGKDKASGVLESVITRPVTKGRIILSRYVANVSSMIIAFAVGTAVFDIFLFHATGTNLSLTYAGSLIWTYFVEITAFTGLIYLVSQYARSQGAILGAAIGLFVIYGFLWTGIITPLLLQYVFHAVSGTNYYSQLTVYLNTINPSGYSSLMVSFISPTGSFGSITNASQFGINRISLTVVGLLWFLVPILLAFFLGRRRD